MKGGSCFFIGPLLATISRQSGGCGSSSLHGIPARAPTLARTAQEIFSSEEGGRERPEIGILLQV